MPWRALASLSEVQAGPSGVCGSRGPRHRTVTAKAKGSKDAYCRSLNTYMGPRCIAPLVFQSSVTLQPCPKTSLLAADSAEAKKTPNFLNNHLTTRFLWAYSCWHDGHLLPAERICRVTLLVAWGSQKPGTSHPEKHTKLDSDASPFDK